MSTLIMFTDTKQLIHLLDDTIFPKLFDKYPKLMQISLRKRIAKYFETENIGGDTLLLMGIKRFQEDILRKANHISNNLSMDSIIQLLEHHAVFYESDKHEKAQFEFVFNDLIQKKELHITELVDVYCNSNEDTTSLSQGLTQHLRCDTNQKREICDLILHKYIQKHEVCAPDFLKILKKTIIDLFPHMNADEYLQIAKQYELDGNLMSKGKQQFMSSIKFARLFKNRDDYDRKDCCAIYRAINRWKPFEIEKDHINASGLYDMIYECAMDGWEALPLADECTLNTPQSPHCNALNRLCFISMHFELLTKRAQTT
eukprot:267385_1